MRPFKLRLYVADHTPNSIQAIANLKKICKTHPTHRFETEIVDVFREPARALADGIFMTPTLVKLAPAPVRRIVGTLNQLDSVLQALDLEAVTV